MRERLKCVALAAADTRGAIDQFAHRSRDGPRKDQPDDDGRKTDGQSRQDELCALLIKMIEDIARRSRCVDDACNPVVDDYGHRRKYVNADAAADGIDRRRGLVRDTNPQGRAILSLQRRRDFLDMGQRLPHFLASGDHDAARIENPESGERDFLRLQNDRHQPCADLDVGRICRRAGRKRIGPPSEQIVASQIERRPDRGDLLFRIRADPRRDFSAENDPGDEASFHFARVDGGQYPTLCVQFGLGLVDKLVVIEPEKEKSDQGQRSHRGQHGKYHQPHRRPPFFAPPRCHACGSHRPSLKPTPWIVSMTLSQFTAESLARILRMWLSMVRSETWILRWYAAVMICSRLKTAVGLVRKVLKIPNSMAVRRSGVPENAAMCCSGSTESPPCESAAEIVFASGPREAERRRMTFARATSSRGLKGLVT